jgi:hypothetical protein
MEMSHFDTEYQAVTDALTGIISLLAGKWLKGAMVHNKRQKIKGKR